MMRRPAARGGTPRPRRLMSLLVSVSAALLSVGAAPPAAVGDEPLVDCHSVSECNHRAVCNRNVLRALAEVDNTTPLSFDNGSARYTVVAIQQERQDRLRAFVAPSCEKPPPPGPLAVLPGLRDRLMRLFAPGSIRETDDQFVRPAFGRPVTFDNAAQLQGRWQGWVTARERKATRVFFEVVHVDTVAVKACSDQGLVMGMLENQALEFPRPEALTVASRMRLWWAPPDYQQLAGVVLLELQPGQEVINGSVWLERAVNYDGSPPPLTYACQDREIEDLKRQREIRSLQDAVRSLRDEMEQLRRQPR